MGSNYRVRAAIEEGRKRAQEKKKRELDADPERQAKKKEALESMNTITQFRKNAKEMKDKIIPTQE